MAEFLEAVMVICFGVSWPVSIAKSLKAKTAKGKSIVFLCFIIVGYAAGIASKLISGRITYVFFFYCLNLLMVSADALIWVRNRRLDRGRE
ncbi:MAG TPA: hypothetical protein PKO20_00545 [Clostridiales bacterium]|nr:hypothetical protein [Clostridiales bacterium]HOJ35121.1 hypothetical protein [Clostridiales bacterium]HOL79609.1 hypothetical protein [Clostridiales bacterium]HPU66645.1 hypothetical protein [Clostridiales bacterium]HQA05757.1 hypothetical protein [Clostridiales bacterium]